MTDKMREEFEVAFVAEKLRLLGEGFRSSALYMIEQDTINVRSAWWAWQASREALVVELPPVPEVPEDPEEAIDDSHMDAYHSAIGMRHACSKFIEAAGVKVKP